MSNREYWKQELVGRMESFSDEEIRELELDKLTPEDTDNLADQVMANEELWDKIEENLIGIIKDYCYNKINQAEEKENHQMTKTETEIAKIIKAIWDSEKANDDDQVEINISDIAACGYEAQDIIDFATKFGIIYDPELLLDEDDDCCYGSLVINRDSFEELTLK